jgi:molybdate transport system substrate-binding protein
VIRAAEEGQAFDLVVISLAAVTDLERRGKLRPGAHREFVASAIGAAVSPSGPRFDVSTSAGLKQALLAAQSVVLSSGPSSSHLLSLIENLGLRDVVAPKLLRLAPGQSVGEALAQGRGELGFTQVSELLSVKGISYLGPLGPEVQRVTVFTFGVRPGETQTPASKQLVEFLTSPEVASRVRHAGLDDHGHLRLLVGWGRVLARRAALRTTPSRRCRSWRRRWRSGSALRPVPAWR